MACRCKLSPHWYGLIKKIEVLQLCHAVDPEHSGEENACVTYVAACPSTSVNKAYIKNQLQSTLAGKPPPDYADGLELDETKFKGYTGHQNLTDEARKALGYGL